MINVMCILPQFKKILLWLVWLSELSTGLRPERSLVQFPVRAHILAAGHVPNWGCSRDNREMFLLHIDVFLPLFLRRFPSLYK